MRELTTKLRRFEAMQKSIAQQFQEMARKDLTAARLLLENNEFPMAIFALQQSVEKTMKALGLESAMVTFDELASGQIGHKAYRIFRAGAQQMSQKVQSVLDLLETDPSALDFLTISKKVFQQFTIIMTAHEADSRYPCANCGHHPPDYYRPGLPLVDNLGKLMEWQSKCLDVMAEFI